MTPRIEKARPTRATRYHPRLRRRRHRLLASVALIGAAMAVLASSAQSLPVAATACALALASAFIAPAE